VAEAAVRAAGEAVRVAALPMRVRAVVVAGEAEAAGERLQRPSMRLQTTLRLLGMGSALVTKMPTTTASQA
jgi:hypothetical protein